MPVGAVIGAAVVGAGATVASGAMASHAQSKAADQASATQQQVASENNQLARDTYAQNASRLDPYSQMGVAAGDAYMGLLLGDKNGKADGSGWATAPSAASVATPAPNNALAPFGGLPSTPTGSALSPVVAQQAQQAIAAGADPAAVRARAASMGVQF